MVRKYSASEMIQSLADVTRHADKELLDISLARTLYKLFRADKIILYKIFQLADKVECYRSIEVVDGKVDIFDDTSQTALVDYSSIDGFVRCFDNKEPITNIEYESISITLFPITDKLDNVISIFRIERTVDLSPIKEELISGCLQIYQNYLNLLNESERDTLTGLLNRRTFDRGLKKICSEHIQCQNEVTDGQKIRAQSQNISHWLAITDIDFFKRINDDFGHIYGDEVLLLLSNIMRETFRSADVLFRFGGEEFVIILRSTDLDGATSALERFRKKVENFEFPKVGKVTTSIGFIEISEHSIPTEILGSADEALYFSKDNGRNQVNQYEQLVADGKITAKQTAEDDIELF